MVPFTPHNRWEKNERNLWFYRFCLIIGFPFLNFLPIEANLSSCRQGYSHTLFISFIDSRTYPGPLFVVDISQHHEVIFITLWTNCFNWVHNSWFSLCFAGWFVNCGFPSDENTQWKWSNHGTSISTKTTKRGWMCFCFAKTWRCDWWFNGNVWCFKFFWWIEKGINVSKCWYVISLI